jgi:hypothetical protein
MTSPTTARTLAAQTPADRNRYADFLRAASILVVVFGHWLMAAPFLGTNGLEGNHLLNEVPEIQAVTWLLQVMPVFFFVGGFANAAAWRSARRRAVPYSAWLRGRLRRLVNPVLPLVVIWSVGAAVMIQTGIDPDTLRLASQAALVPVWFLAVYVVVVSLAPLSLLAWERSGWWSFGVPAALAGLVDLVALGGDVDWFGYINYLLVWCAVHQLGYAWADGRFGGLRQRLAWAGAGFGVTAALVGFGPYPLAMVGLATDQVANSQPPKVTLVALAAFQIGLALALESRAERFLQRGRPWTATVAISSMIMTVYLWHMTAMVALIGGLLALDGFGLAIPVGSGGWWASRLPWLATLGLVIAPFVLWFSRYERPGPDNRPAPPAWRPVLAAVTICGGLGLLAYAGIADQEGLNGLALSLPFVGALVGGIVGARYWLFRRGTRRPTAGRAR